MARILAARNGRVQNSPPMIKRCWVGGDDPLMLAYHDEEWGVPVHDDRALFGKLVLDGFQAGLSWRVILHKRARFLVAFDGFDPARMARYDRRKVAQLDRKSTRLNSSHLVISYAVFCLKKKKKKNNNL